MTEAQDDLVAQAREREAEGRLDLAADLWAEALEAAPGHENILEGVTSALVRLGRPQDAVFACRRAIEAGSTSTFPHRLAAVFCFNDLKDASGAVAWLRDALIRHPDDTEVHRLLASIGFQTLDRDLARTHGLKALADCDDRTALAVRRVILADYEGALEIGARLLAADPTDVDVLVHCAIAHHMLGHLESAIGYYFRAAEHAPYRGDVLYPLADALLLLGDTRAGWRRFETVADDAQIAGLHPKAAAYLDRFWRGQDLAGRRILVLNLLGLGDSLMYLRYARDLRDAGAHVTLCCRPELLRLFAGAEGVDALCDAWPLEALDQFDYWVFDLLLPVRFGAGEGRIPAWPQGYIRLPAGPSQNLLTLPDRAASRLQVGLCWTTTSAFYSGTTRLLWPEDLRPLAEVPGVDWHVLQKRPREPNFGAVSGLDVHDVSNEWADFQDTARFAEGLDLTISICSAPVHLVGALGLPIWAMIADPPEWRWGRTGAQSRWYPQARIFRQASRGDWLSVTAAIARALEEERENLMRARPGRRLRSGQGESA
jgi:tetratricopeptide (TPR) repeat protein